MNCEQALAQRRENFKVETQSFDHIPNQSKLFLDFQLDADSIQTLYPSRNTDFEKLSQNVLANYKIDREVLCDILHEDHVGLNAQPKTLENIQKLRSDDCVAVIAGQQAGLFSGSMYTIYKALSAIKLANELTAQGIKAVPMFWIASEDHDFEEANKTFILNENGNIDVISNDVEGVQENTPVAFIKLGDQVQNAIDEYFQGLRQTEFSKDAKGLLEEIYQPSETYSSSFAKFILRLFGDCGLILVCPMNKGLRQLCSPIFEEAIEKHEEITTELLNRDSLLAERGYHSQVHVDEDFFPFFYLDENKKRNALRFDKEHDSIKSLYSEQTFKKQDLIEIARKSPHQLSPNVLMRSVVQDYLFPTVCYYGGSAEIAYFAQNEVVYSTLNRPVTKFRHRASFTIVDPKSKRTLDRYELGFADMFRGQEDLLAEIIEKFIADKTAKTFTEVEETINHQMQRLEEELVKSEPTLSENLKNRRKKIQWHIDTLRAKFHRAETFKNDVVRRRIEFTIASLYPKDALQERTMNVMYFFNLFGPNFINWLNHSIDLDEKEHQILYL